MAKRKPHPPTLYKPGANIALPGELYMPANGKVFTLPELQKAVGGYIEIVILNDFLAMVVNEEGHIHGLPYNEGASMLYWASGRRSPIVGTVLVCERGMLD